MAAIEMHKKKLTKILTILKSKYGLVWNHWGPQIKGEFTLACKYISLGLQRMFSVKTGDKEETGKKSHFGGIKVKEVICGCWETGAKPLPFTQTPLSLQPVGEGQKNFS